MASWFGSSAKADPAESVEMERRGEVAEGEEHLHDESEQKLLPDMTEEEIEQMKVEKAKKARRNQLDIILSSETSIGATLTALKKSLAHYEREKMDLYTKRQKYRIVVANYKGPVDDTKLEAIKKILHDDLPRLIDEMDDRIINGHIQVTSLERQLANLRTQRLKAERSYQRLFEPMTEGDLEGGPDYFSDNSSDIGKDATIEDVLRKFDPEFSAGDKASSQALAAKPIDETTTSSEEEEDNTFLPKKSSGSIQPPATSSGLKSSGGGYYSFDHSDDQPTAAPSRPPAILEARPSEDTIAVPLD